MHRGGRAGTTEGNRVGISVAILWAALSSTQRSRLIPPHDCPPCFLHEGRVQYDQMRDTLRQLPALPKIEQALRQAQRDGEGLPPLLDETQSDLLAWIGQHPDGHRLVPSSFTEFAEEFPHAARQVQRVGAQPTLILRVDSPLEEKQDDLFRQYGSLVAYHGSRLDAFQSILRHGFQEECIRLGQGLFGDGLYFSTDPLVAKQFIQFHTLESSLQRVLGDQFPVKERMGCCLVTQVAKHPDVRHAEQEGSAGETYWGIRGSGPIARHYVLAPRRDLVRARYLFVYGRQGSATRLLLIVAILYVFVILFLVAFKSKLLHRTLIRQWAYLSQ